MAIPKRALGKTGAEVSCLGLGGEGVLRTFGRQPEAERLIRRALDLGVSYFESARAYAGSEEYLGHSLGKDRQRVFLASKSHARRARGARSHLDESLALLRTDWLDLWMVHDVRTQEDLDVLLGPGGALEAFLKARDSGEVRFLGVSGHHDPDLLAKALDLFPFDCVLMPVNAAEKSSRAFADIMLPKAREKGLGVIAMKTLCRGFGPQLAGPGSAALLLRYALFTEGVCIASVGCDSVAQLEENAAAAEGSEPLPAPVREGLEQSLSPFARQLLYYRPTAR